MLMGKTIYDGDNAMEDVLRAETNAYNARGRMSEAAIDSDCDEDVDVTTTYTYDDSGIRIRQSTTHDSTTIVTEFVADANNATGYTQTIEEHVDGELLRSYTFGLDEIVQAVKDNPAAAAVVSQFLHDGRGSVRQLADAIAELVTAATQGMAEVLKLDYTAYGTAVNYAAETVATALLHNGEFVDPVTEQQYLRARWYDQATGRFNRVDPFAGEANVPQSLHKYLFSHGDPVTHTDPSGQVIPLILIIGGWILAHQTMVLGFAALAAVGGVAFALTRTSAHLANLGSIGGFSPVDTTRVEVLYHSIRIRGSTLSSNAVFGLVKDFPSRDMRPVKALDSADTFGGLVEFDMLGVKEAGQANFFVMVTHLSERNRTLTVRAMTGHPVSGWRHWSVSRLTNGDLLVETFAVDHASSLIDHAKLALGGKQAQSATWQHFLSDVATRSGGTVVPGGSYPHGVDRTDMASHYLRIVQPISLGP